MLTKIYSGQITTWCSRLDLILTTFLNSTSKMGFSGSNILDLFSTKNPQYIYTEFCSSTFRDLILIQGCVSQTVLEAYAVFTFDDSWLWFMYTYCMIIKKRSIFMGGIFDNIIAAMFIHMCTYINGVLFQKRYQVSLMLSFLIDMQNFGHNGKDQCVNFY